MKNTARKIAIILILIMAVNCFTGCMTTWVMNNNAGLLMLFTVPLDIVTLPLQIVIGISYLVQDTKGTEEIQKKYREFDNIDTFSPEIVTLSLRFNSLPEAEIAHFTETIGSFSEEEISALFRAFNDLTEAEIASSLETLNSMPDKTFIAALNSCQYTEWRRQ